jgi:Spy/CpxP family protein refolding chaperone
MKKRLIISAVLLLTLTVTAFTAFADSGRNKAGRNQGSMRAIIQTVFSIAEGLRGLAQDLNLSAAQKAAVREIVVNARPQAEELHKQLAAKRHQLRDTLLAANSDAALVQTLTGDIANLNAQITVLRIQTITQISQQLTPEQKARALEDLMEIDPLIEELKDEIKSMAINFSENNR